MSISDITYVWGVAQFGRSTLDEDKDLIWVENSNFMWVAGVERGFAIGYNVGIAISSTYVKNLTGV